MNTGRFTGFLAGAVCLYGLAAHAAEGPAYRGLKLPANTFENDASSYGIALSAAGARRSADIALPDFAPRILFTGNVQTRALRAGDYEYRFALHQPFGHNVAALSEPSIHSLHDVVPRYTLYSHVTQLLPGGWGIGLGVRQTEYNFYSANLLSLSAERYWGSFRGAYTLFSSRAEGATLGSAHRFEVTYLYGERNTIGLSYTTGRDIDNFNIPTISALSDTRDWSLSGRHWLSPNWALHYDLLSQEQGTMYRRQGLRLGVSRAF